MAQSPLVKRGSKRIKEVTASALYCKSGCGFYGNSAWAGYCSKCYKDQERKPATYTTTPENGTEETESAIPEEGPNFKFDKFEEKKKVKRDSKTDSVKKFFTKSPLTKADFEKAKADLKSTSHDLVEFLKTLKRPASKDLKDKCQTFIMRFLQNTELDVEQQSHLVQEFYSKMAAHIQSNDSFRDSPPEQMEFLMDGIEKYVMTHIYNVVFCCSKDDQRKDRMLKEKIKSFSWVTFDQLEINVDFDREEAKRLMLVAKQEMMKLNQERAPQDKLARIVKCCLTIFQLLKLTNGNEIASADEFLPALIYVVLKSQIPFLQSNIQYITRFCNPNKLMAGEGGYYFTNLCCATTFILENLDAQSLNLSQDEFDSYMKGETPIRNPKIVHREYSFTCKGLEDGQENLRKLAKLHECQAKTLERCRTMRKEMSEFREAFTKQVHACFMGEHEQHGYVYVQHYLDKFDKRFQDEQIQLDNDDNETVEDDSGSISGTSGSNYMDPPVSAMETNGSPVVEMETAETVDEEVESETTELLDLMDGIDLQSNLLNLLSEQSNIASSETEQLDLLNSPTNGEVDVLLPDSNAVVTDVSGDTKVETDHSLDDDFNELLKFNDDAVAEVLTDLG